VLRRSRKIPPTPVVFQSASELPAARSTAVKALSPPQTEFGHRVAVSWRDDLSRQDRSAAAKLYQPVTGQVGVAREEKPTFAAPRQVINLMEALRRSIAEDKKPIPPRRAAAVAPVRRPT
jgi:hypothetical protein